MSATSGCGDEYECCVCMDDFQFNTVMNCGVHYICFSCFTDLINKGKIDFTLFDYYSKHNMIECPCDCSNHFDEEAIIDSKNIELIKAYMEMKSIYEVKIAFDENNKKEIVDVSKSTERLISKIFEDIPSIITNALRCPSCESVFYDFDGCLALTCSSCKNMFCGVCLDNKYEDSHECVMKHSQDYDLCSKFEIHSSYFITETGWKKYREFLQKKELIRYLKSLDQKLIFDSIDDICDFLFKNKMFSGENIYSIKESIFSHDIDFIRKFHLIRLPQIVWSLISTKIDARYEYVVKNYPLDSYFKVHIGKEVLKNVRAKYPKFKTVKIKVPGETYSAICYPPETLETVTETIIKYCRKYKCFGDLF